MNDSKEVPPSPLTSLLATRPRPRRNHKPSTPSSVSPSYNTLTSFFDDDQLATFFPTWPLAAAPHAPSSLHPGSSSVSENDHFDCIERVQDTTDGEKEEEEKKEEEEEEEEEERKEEQGEEETVRSEGAIDTFSLVEEDDDDDDIFDNLGDEACEGATNRTEELLTKVRRSSPLSSYCSLNPSNPPSPSSSLSPYYPFSPSSTFSPSSPFSSSMAPFFPPSTSSATQQRPSSRPTTGSTSSSSSSSSSSSFSFPFSTSSAKQRCSSSSSSSSSNSSSIPDAGLSLSSPPANAVENEDLHGGFVFPPKISRLGSFYSHLGLSCSDGDSHKTEGGRNSHEVSPDNTSPENYERKMNARRSLHQEISPDNEIRKNSEKESDQKHTLHIQHEWDAEGTSKAGPGTPRHSHSSSRSSLGSLKVNGDGSGNEWGPKRSEVPEPFLRPGASHPIQDEAERETTLILRNKVSRDETDDSLMNETKEPTPPRAAEGTGEEDSGQQTKKVPPAKPPRLSANMRARYDDDRRRSREDPVRYENFGARQELNLKKSASMTNILETDLETVEVPCSRFSQCSTREVPGLVDSPLEPLRNKRNKRIRRSSGIREAARVVTAKLISKTPPLAPLLERNKAHKLKPFMNRRFPQKDVAATSSLSPSPSPSVTSSATTDYHDEGQNQDDAAAPANLPPAKPPRKNLQDVLDAGSLDMTQSICAAHGAVLNFYCVKCRAVVCRDCTVVAHGHSQDHKVLDTMDALVSLRSEAVALLRHYTILETMHATLMDIYRRFAAQRREIDTAAMDQRLEEGRYLAETVKEAEHVMSNWTNLHEIRERVGQWEARQQEWGDLVFLATRCALLADMHVPSDTVFLRMGSWVMPTPWIQLSHLLQPYLGTSTASRVSSSSLSSPSSTHLATDTVSRTLHTSSPVVKRSRSPVGGATSTGGTDQPFPYNARQVVLSILVPYIILNPDIRYFVHVGGLRDVDLTLVVVPVVDHAQDYLKRRRNNAIKSPEMLRRGHYLPPIDAITLVEQQMTSGATKTRITASSMPLGLAATPVNVKVSFLDVNVVSDGHGLPAAKGGVKRGDVIVDQSPSGRSMLTVALQDIGDFPALRLGRVTWGMDGLACLVGAEDTKRAEASSGFRAKLRATVRREEEAVYDVIFGMDL